MPKFTQPTYSGETYQTGAENLAKFIGISVSTLRKVYLPNMKQVGAVIELCSGRPPRNRIRWLPSRIIRYLEMWQAEKYRINHSVK
jgi:hypothetical protein